VQGDLAIGEGALAMLSRSHVSTSNAVVVRSSGRVTARPEGRFHVTGHVTKDTGIARELRGCRKPEKQA